MGFAKVFHFFLFRHLGPNGTCMTFVGEPKFSISSSFSPGDTRSSICRSYAPCARWLHSVLENPCVLASCGASFDEILATCMSSTFSSASGDTTYSGTHRLYRCQCYGHLSFEMLCSFRYQVLAQLVSFRYLPASRLPQVSRGCGREEQALRSPRSVVVSGSAASQGWGARTKVLVMSELSDS